MNSEELVMADGVVANKYSFSDHVICVEVKKNGKDLGSFCSDVSQFEELDEEELTTLIQQHVNLVEASSIVDEKVKHRVGDYELECYSHYDSVCCINVLQNGEAVSSFCVDRASFEEWLEDEEQLLSVVNNLKLKK
ncbi:MAG: hypothetical protein LRY73_01590 [Bacillus sp. (in: Bacteria)]|nr:hypothetical protein [Bacillus sp. (in: firmicutes)]